MTGPDLSTYRDDVRLIAPNVDRDAPSGVRWLSGPVGRETLRSMGVIDVENNESTVGLERRRLQTIIDDSSELAWMIRYNGQTVGIVEVCTEENEYIKLPSMSIMIDDVAARGKGIGSLVIQSV